MTTQWDPDEEQIIYRPPPSVCRSCGSTIRVTAPLALCDTPPQIFLPSPISSAFPSLAITVQLVLPSSNGRIGMRDVAVQVGSEAGTRDASSETTHSSCPPSELSAGPTIGDVLLRYLSPSGTGESLSAHAAGDCPAVEPTHEAQQQGAALPEPVSDASVKSPSTQAVGGRPVSPAPKEAQPQRAAQSDPASDATVTLLGSSGGDSYGSAEESGGGASPNLDGKRAASPPSTPTAPSAVASAASPSPAQIAVPTPPHTTFSFTPRNLPPPTVISAGAPPLPAPKHYSSSPSGKPVAAFRPLKPLPRVRAVLPAPSPSAAPAILSTAAKAPPSTPSAVLSAKPPTQSSPKAERTMYGMSEQTFFDVFCFPHKPAAAAKTSTTAVKPFRQPHPPSPHTSFQIRPSISLVSSPSAGSEIHTVALPDGFLQLRSTPPSSPTAPSPVRPSMTTAPPPPAPPSVQSWTSLKDTIARLTLDMAPIHLPADVEAGRKSPVRSKARRGPRSTASLARRAGQKAAHQMGSAVA